MVKSLPIALEVVSLVDGEIYPEVAGYIRNTHRDSEFEGENVILLKDKHCFGEYNIPCYWGYIQIDLNGIDSSTTKLVYQAHSTWLLNCHEAFDFTICGINREITQIETFNTLGCPELPEDAAKFSEDRLTYHIEPLVDSAYYNKPDVPIPFKWEIPIAKIDNWVRPSKKLPLHHAESQRL